MQDRFLAEGKKLTAEEKAKREKNPFEMWDEMRANSEAGKFPKGTDVFLYKYHGLFYVAPAQNSFMCRLRFAGGMTNSHQFRGVADLAEQFGGGYADVTTRANLQIREIQPKHARRAHGPARSGHRQSRRRGRQHPQRHRLAHRRHRPAGADRHAAAGPRDAPLHPQPSARCTACRGSSTSPSTAAARSPPWPTPTTSASWPCDRGGADAVLRRAAGTGRLFPHGAGRHHRPQGFRPRLRRAADARPSACRSPRPWCGSSSNMATGPTARRPG